MENLIIEQDEISLEIEKIEINVELLDIFKTRLENWSEDDDLFDLRL